MNPLQATLKKLFDFGAAVVLLIVALPVFALSAMIIKTFSRGPILYVQERCGLGARPFRIYKFRTMTVGAEDLQTGSVSVRGDVRVFRGANLLRKLKIDELPQLFNVLNGTMSLVGPRPTVRDDYLRMDERQRRRVSVKPGLTGLAQVRGNTSLSWPERIEYDLQYIDRHSLWLDLSILLETLVLVVTGRAETHPQGSDEWASI